MDVIIQSMVETAQGRITVAADPSQTVGSLITAFCIDNEIPQKPTYYLENCDGDILHNDRRIGSCGIQHGDVLYLMSREVLPKFHCNKWWLLAAICLVIGGAGVVVSSIVKVYGDEPVFSYAVVIDAGSTHTNLFVYQWPGGKNNGTGDVTQVAYCGGEAISDFADNPSQAAKPIVTCIENTALKSVPSSQFHDTPIYVAATAGMRLLNEANQNASDAILETIRSAIKKYDFDFPNPMSQVRLLTGREEGVYGWIAVNYLLHKFQQPSASKWSFLLPWGSTFKTLGAMDMGGASTQLSFIPASNEVMPPKYVETAVLYGVNYTLYSNSFLCYGKKEAERKFRAILATDQNSTNVTNPCGPNGYMFTYNYSDIFEAPCTKGPNALGAWGHIMEPNPAWNKSTKFRFTGSGDSSACDKKVLEMFNFTCTYPSCSFNGQYIPSLHGNYLAFSSFFYNTEFLNLTDKSFFTLTEYKKARDDYCRRDWDDVKKIPTPFPSDRIYACFDAHYIITLLTQGYHFHDSNWNQLKFQKKIAGADVNWAYGFMLNATNQIPAAYPNPPFTLPVFVLLMVLFAIFIMLSVGFACHAKSFQKEENYEKLATYGSL